MKVLRISHTASFTSYRQRERALAKHRIELRVVTAKDWPHLGREESGSETGFRVREIGCLGAGNVPLFAYDPSALHDEIKSFSPDIIDIHEEAYSVSGFESAWLASHAAPKAKMLFYTAQNILKQYPPPFCWTEQFVYSRCAAAYPCSAEASNVLQTKGFKGIRQVLPLGVDTEVFAPTCLSDSEAASERARLRLEGLVVGYFGRIESYKGIDVLLKAAAQLKPKMMISLVMVGTGNGTEKYKMDARQLGLDAVWLGEAKAREIPKLMRLCDVIVVPSLTTPGWREQFGRVVVEAMACGVPTIVSNSGSLVEVAGDCALVAPEGDVSQLAECIYRLAKDDSVYTDLRQRGLHLVNDRYTWEHIAEMTINLYQRIL